MRYCNTCPSCGAHLDPGERCDCKDDGRSQEKSNIFKPFTDKPNVEMIVLKDREAWLKHRMSGIGGSEISAIIGQNPYMDNVTLWEIKTGRREAEDISGKPYVKYGTAAEYHLRELFKLDFPEYEVSYVENNSFKNSQYPWALASLDGWMRDKDGRLGVAEFKTTEILQSMQREKWNKRLPMNYYCQVLFYMGVVEADFSILKAQLKSVYDNLPYLQTKHYQMECDEVQEDINYIMNAGAEFWDCVVNDRKPALVLPEI